MARAPLSGISQGRTVSPHPSPAGRSEQREAPKGATDHRTADSMPPGVCWPLFQLLPCVYTSRSARQDPGHCPGPICTLPDWMGVEKGLAEPQTQAAVRLRTALPPPPWSLPSLISLPPTPAQAGALPCCSLRSPAPVPWAGLQGSPPLPYSEPKWDIPLSSLTPPSLLPSSTGHPRLGSGSV